VAEQGTAIAADDVRRRYEDLHALVEGEWSRAKDTAALNHALRSLLSAATVDWIDYLGVEVHFTLVGDGPGLSAFTLGGQPDRIRREGYYAANARWNGDSKTDAAAKDGRGNLDLHLRLRPGLARASRRS
jgi:hypothetical protein